MIQLTNLQKVLGQQTVVSISHLEILPGQVVAITGAADSGKEALFDLLVGETQPSLAADTASD